MNFDQALERALTDYYGRDTISSRIPKTKHPNNPKEKQTMTREQLINLNKVELNRLITPFSGGYTSGTLRNIKKEVLVDEVIKYQEEKLQKPRKSKEPKPRVTDIIADILIERGKLTSDEIIVRFIAKSPGQNKDSLSRTIHRHLHSMRVKYDVRKEKYDNGEIVYWIEEKKS